MSLGNADRGPGLPPAPLSTSCSSGWALPLCTWASASSLGTQNWAALCPRCSHYLLGSRSTRTNSWEVVRQGKLGPFYKCGQCVVAFFQRMSCGKNATGLTVQRPDGHTSARWSRSTSVGCAMLVGCGTTGWTGHFPSVVFLLNTQP